MRTWLDLSTGSVPVVSQAASAAIVLAGAAWLAGVSSGGLANALQVKRSAGIVALGATALLAWTGFWRIAGGRTSPLGLLTSKLGISPPSLMAAASRDLRTASPVWPQRATR